MGLNGQSEPHGPFLYNPEEVASAKKVAILIPGALARVEMFATARPWSHKGYALVHYRFPGLDGRPLAPKLKIEVAAGEVSDFMSVHFDKRFFLLGFSTGGPIAISAAERSGRDVRVAAMCSAVEKAGGWVSFRMIMRDVLSAAARVKSIRRNRVWLEYFKILLLGRDVPASPELEARAQAMLDAHLPRMVYPDPPLLAAHSDDLRRWTLPPRARLEDTRLAFFQGSVDPVFSEAQTQAFAKRFGAPHVRNYAGQGHLLFMTHPAVFDDILDFFEA